MNELQAKFGEKGLTVIGVTDEGAKDTESFASATKMNYAYAYDKGGKLSSWAGVSGIPAAILLDPSGKVVWQGHPGSLSEDAIQKALVGALEKPLWDWPASAKDVRAALTKQAYSDALAKAAKLTEADGGPAIQKAIQGIVAGKVAALKAAMTAGNFLAVSTTGAEIAKAVDGLPEKADVEKVLADLEANKDAKKVIQAQKKVAELRDKKWKKRELEGAIADLKKMAKANAGNYAATEAEELAAELDKLRRKKD
ncbi:MAG: TlpA family protein disulfide reductase [Planctomycetes bacterium]|nr:TlpA family protein disulfide reductase [Planctomycetota bacterium]